ncbi:MAG TPA: isoprenylcysteine carboxylmethyltransferase family protein [Candidatus Eremiobacteraceae bacterium]|nr:isoprenylcysteine carboxylmethyltransferase family protein [Candidatus Eremiobacteraceae bacterium]
MSSSIARQDNAGVRFPPPFIYLLGLLLAWPLERFVPLHLPLGLVRWPLAALLLLGWLALWFMALPMFRKAHTPISPVQPTTALMTTGIYGRTRNPLYLGLALFYLMITVVAQSGWMLVLFVPVMLIIRFAVIAAEERYLDRRFGQEYLDYKKRVPRWL